MPSSYHTFTGPCMWAKLAEHNLDTKFDAPKTKINLFLGKEDLARLKATGSQLRPKVDLDTGKIFVTFSRKFINDRYPKLGGLPKVVYNNEEYTGLIGNGSTVSVTVEVYDTKLGKGTRMEKVVINDLVEFKREEPAEAVSEDVIPF